VLALPALYFAGTLIVGLIALYSVAVWEWRRWRVIAAGVLGFAAATGWAFAGPIAFDVIIVVTYSLFSTAAPLALGLFVRTNRELAGRVRDLEQSRASEERLAAEELLATERRHLAREMHDVVSHQVSLIAIQAGALQVTSTDPRAADIARTIRSLAARTLDELRDMVITLRTPADQATPLAPQPTIADLRALIADSGIEATVDLELPDDLSAGIQRAVYRMVQECLTNIHRHAPGANATITGRADPDVSVVVTNTASEAAPVDVSSAKHGLIGLRERAELLGGTLTVQAVPDGGYSVSLRVPRGVGGAEWGGR
jgi:signal transduction histidine kinase